jgi:hypothetical protein
MYFFLFKSIYGDWTKDAGGISNIGRMGGIVVVSYFLPVLVHRDDSMPGGWHVEWDHEALLSCKTALLRVTRIGTVKLAFGDPIKAEEKNAVTNALLPFNCVPIFIDKAIADVFYNDFCKKTLWPVFHNLLEIYGNSPTGQALGPETETLPADSAVGSSSAPPNPITPSNPMKRGGSSDMEDDAGGYWYSDATAKASKATSHGGVGSVISPPPSLLVSPPPPPSSRLASRSTTGDDAPASIMMSGGGGGGGVSPSFIAKVASETENILLKRDLSSTNGLYQPTNTSTSGEADKWASYMSVQRMFKTKIMEMYHEGDVVWIHGFHLLLVPTLLAKAATSLKMGIFLHTPFPSSEIFRTLGRREDLLRGMLSADQVYTYIIYFACMYMQCCKKLFSSV